MAVFNLNLKIFRCKNRDGKIERYLSTVVGFTIAPKYECFRISYSGREKDILSKHVVCRGFESHFRAIGIAQLGRVTTQNAGSNPAFQPLMEMLIGKP